MAKTPLKRKIVKQNKQSRRKITEKAHHKKINASKSSFKLKETRHGGEVFCVGDDVYVVVDEALLRQDIREVAGEYDQCQICESGRPSKGKLLECDRCLLGYHLSCLTPPLERVPQGSWVCPRCTVGKTFKMTTSTLARDMFLHRRGLCLARIMAIRQNVASGDVSFTARWYTLPEETHVGRQHHHLGREVFMSHIQDEASIESIYRKANVMSMDEYRRCIALDEDDFVCDYEYNHNWQRFQRCSDKIDRLFDDDWDSVSVDSDDSDDERRDATYNSLEDELRHLASGPRRCLRHARSKKPQGGTHMASQLGSRDIPSHIRSAVTPWNNALRQARHALTLAATPESLPCREQEHAAVTHFVEEVITGRQGNSGKCLYISGIPGTGKTATVLDVMKRMRRRAESGEVPSFQFVEINGLRLPSPQHAYSALYEALTGESLGPATAAAALDTLLTGSNSKRHTIVLLDEMDSLINRTQTVLYNLFDWPSRSNSYFSVIGIANTMDLPERLHPRIGSRLAGCRIVFHPYQRDQLETIMHSRLKECAHFDANAITLVARKVANCSGDVRRCLELCRRAAEIAIAKREQHGTSEAQVRVTIRDVDGAIREAFHTTYATMIRQSCLLERLLLASIHIESRYKGQAEVEFENVYRRLISLNGNQRTHVSSVLESAIGLAAQKLILCDPGLKRLKAKMALNIPLNDLLFALSNDPQLIWLADKIK